MADSRTFTLIGEFKDGITPELAKINKQLATLKASFAGIGSRKNSGFRGATNDIGKLVSAHKKLSESIKVVQGDLRSTVGVLQQYRREMSQAAAATRAFQKAGGNLGGSTFAKNMRQANTEAQRYLRTLQQINSQQPRAVRPPRGGGGGGGGGGGRRGGGHPGGGPGGFHMAEFGFAYTLGTAISQPIQNAVVQGFQIGISFMTKPFEYFAQNFGERVRDELSDLKAAGGFFSISQRQEGEKFIKSFDQAVDFTQQNNKILAQLAASLPGSTQDYIEVSKRISDSVARTVVRDRGNAVKYAEELRRTDPTLFGDKSLTSMSSDAQQRKTIQIMLAELTKKTVLAGQGGRAGAGGAMGAYGLPQLTERILSQQDVSMGQFQRYSAIFSDPMIMDALSREIPNINKTAANSVERFKAIQTLYDSVLPPELIARYRRTIAGVAETFNTAIFGPETGLFGLGRKMEGLGNKFNEFGQVVKDAEGKIEKAELSLFDMVRDILGNLGQVFAPIAENITLIYDPIRKIAEKLVQVRNFSAKLLESFNYYLGGFQDLKFEGNAANLRASLATIANLLRYVGAISTGDFEGIVNQLKGKNVDFGAMMTGLLDKLLNSKAATQLGEIIGKIIGTVLVEVAKVTGFISGRIGGTNNLVAGLQKGFKDAGGEQAFGNIFKDVFYAMFNILKEIWNLIPWQGKMLAAFMLVVPAAIQGLAMLIAQGITSMIGKARDACMGSFTKSTRGMGCDLPGGGGGPGGRRRGRYGAGGSMDRLNRLRRYKMLQGAKFAGEVGDFGYSMAGRPGSKMLGSMGKTGRGVGRTLSRASRAVPGGAVAAGAIDMGIAMATGENFGQAAAGAIGTVLGGTVGSIFGPVGTVIGSVVGGMLADAAADFAVNTLDQNKAAALQMEAARKQVEAAAASAVTKYGPEFGEQLGGVEAINQALGGGAGVKAYAEEQLRLGKILPEQAKSWSILGDQLVGVNSTTEKVKKAQSLYDTAVRLNTGQQQKYKQMLEAAQKEQQAALGRITTNWESMSATNRAKLLSGADNIRAALDEAAAKIRGWKGLPGITPAPPPKSPVVPSATSDTGRERLSAPSGLNSRKLIPGLPATPESGYGAATGRLGDAVASEMRMKPPGSDLVIANSSETVIPAAGGYGMLDFVETLRAGFAAVVSTYKQTQQTQNQTLTKINSTLVTNQQQTNTRLSAMEKKFSSPAMGGLGGGSVGGGVDAFTGMAQKYGLQMTSGYRPGDPGWHGSNRARDFSNGTGPTPQMMQFAQFLASNYGSNLKELIYTPLGFSIKNGQRVAPYAQSSHNNHVHVAYAMGLGQGVAFNSLSGAQAWENSMVSGSVKVGSVTGNSAEGFGGGTTVTNNITINQQPGQSADELASIVAMKIGEAVADARASSIFV